MLEFESSSYRQIFGFSLTLVALYLYREFKNDPNKFRDSLSRPSSFVNLFIPSESSKGASTSQSSSPISSSTSDPIEMKPLLEEDNEKAKQ